VFLEVQWNPLHLETLEDQLVQLHLDFLDYLEILEVQWVLLHLEFLDYLETLEGL
jgi:hypothetical protein